MPSADICVHYSLKWNYRQNVDQSFSDFSCFCASLTGHKRVSVLLVSGGGKKRKLDSVEVCSVAHSGLACSKHKMLLCGITTMHTTVAHQHCMTIAVQL
jgi:hypothetical protein